MGQQQSKDELLYQQVSYGNIEGIKALHRDGAALEYLDKDGKTPLIFACLNPFHYHVAKTLVELGANVNAYRPGRNGGTPLHHAAKRGLEDTVKLLLSHGANALLVNDDCQTPLDIARAKGYSKVVRAIEDHICLYSGWLKELYGPGFLEMLAPQLLSRKVWVVVVPCGSRNFRKPFKLELAIYTSLQDAQPCTSILLTRAGMEEPDFSQPSPTVTISETSIPRRQRRRRCRPRHVVSQTRVKLAPLSESDVPQLQQFCNACKGIPQVMHPILPINPPPPVLPSTAPQAAPEAPSPLKDPTPNSVEDMELTMAKNASLQSALIEGIPIDHEASSSSTIVNTVSFDSPVVDPPSKISTCSEQILEEVGPSATSTATSNDPLIPMPSPSAPTIDDFVPDGPIHYPTIDTSTVENVDPLIEKRSEDGNKRDESSTCVICFDAPVEAACVPCGHMAGCMSCLNEVKAKKWGCPVCRADIDQVIKVYAV